MYKKIILLVVIISAANFSLRSQTRGNLHEPTREEMLLRYKKAARLDSAVRTSVYYQYVQPVWFEKGNRFWYQRIHPDSTMEYLEVNPEKGVKKIAFDHSRLAVGLSAVTKKTIQANRLEITINRVDGERKQMEFSHDHKRWELDLISYVIRPVNSNDRNFRWTNGENGWTKRSRWMNFSTDAVSPDKKWKAEVINHNLQLKSLTGATEIQLTSDGTEYAKYGSMAWSPDGSYLIFYRILPYEDSVIHYLKMAGDASTRGGHFSIPYKQPGDPFTSYEMMVYKIGEKEPGKINIPIIDFFGAPYLHFNKTQSGKFLFERVDRGHQRFRILEADIHTGEIRTVYDEQTNSFIYESRIFTDYLPETNEIILSSEKDGWRHLYLLDIVSGKIKNQISSGSWIVKEIDSIDYKKREIWFRGAGMKELENPYYVHHYRIGFDGRNLVELNPETGHHQVSYSADGKYFLDSYSEVNKAPIITVRSGATGKKLMTVETPDTSRLKALQIPTAVPFKAKGRDGKTDIWGVVCWPVDMDSMKQYPVIEHIYAGPQDAFVPKSYLPYSEMQSMAALGFIVVQIDGMGTANRSKAFHDVCWKNLADGGFPDRIRWIKALAETYPWVDTTRVGLYGTSAGGQNALGGLLFHPSFYKAAVSACGCHDNRIDKQWWNEQWMGYPVGQHYEAQSNITHANKLSGNLLLIVGDEDNNVPPESTYRVADALIKSGKHFELLSIPGMGHSDGGPYGRIRKRDFFVKSLFRIVPPDRNK